MNITLLTLALGLLLLVLPAYALWWLDRRLLTQSALVVGRLTVALALTAVCLYYVFRWNLVWLNVVWVLLSGLVATVVYCRKRWLRVPIYISMTLCSLVVGLLVLLLMNVHGSMFRAQYFVPVMAVLQADALFVCRRGLTAFVLNNRQYGSLKEYLKGNGANEREALRPIVAQAVKRAFAPVLSMLLIACVVFMPSMLGGLLLGGVQPLQSLAVLAVLTAGGLCCAVVALLLAIVIYTKLKKD
ncbi:MAG: ABC transporter permease [Prevotella sp.]|nr:ABC transporter permease [Prevotella sp.]